MTKRLSVWNPMDNPESREKVRQSKLGIKNPQAIYDYYFTKEDGTEIKVECLREYCKEHPDIRRASIITAAKTGKKYKNMFIRKVLKNGRINRNNAPQLSLDFLAIVVNRLPQFKHRGIKREC